MTKVRSIPMWHVYGANLPKKGFWYTVTIKPDVPQEMPTVLGPHKIFETGIEVTLPHLASFDHEPTDEEMDILREAYDRD